MMNGEQFVDTLKRIGYPGAEKLNGRSFDWLFDCEALLPFLSWFCEEIQESNVLSEKELKGHRDLLDTEPSSLLEGSQLEEALHRWSVIDSSRNVDGTVSEAELSCLSEELIHHQRHRDQLKLLYDKLSLHHTALVDRVARINAVKHEAHSEYQLAVEQIHLENSRMNKTIESLLKSVSDLLTAYNQSAAQSGATADLSHINMEHYHSAEEKFTQQLTAFTKKQFFDGIAEMAGHIDGEDYQLIEISNPDLLLVKGSSEDRVLDACKELTHVQSVYPVSEKQRLDALIEDRSMAGACEYQENLTKHYKDNPFPTDDAHLSVQLKEAQAKLASVRRDLAQLTDTTLPKQIRDASSLQSVKMLRGDYDLKIARQDYFTSNQDKVIGELVVQRSRNEFLMMALELESRGHRDVHKLLTAITILLEKMNQTFNQRMQMMSEVEKYSSRVSRATVDSRDKFMLSMNELIVDGVAHKDHQPLSTLSTTAARPLFVTHSEIEQNTDAFLLHLSTQKASLNTAVQSENERYLALDCELAACESKLYSDATTSTSRPALSPPQITDAITRLDGLIKKLEQVVMDVIKDIDSKKKTLQKDQLLKTERELFCYFYNDPSKLRYALNDLEARLQAHTSHA